MRATATENNSGLEIRTAQRVERCRNRGFICSLQACAAGSMGMRPNRVRLGKLEDSIISMARQPARPGLTSASTATGQNNTHDLVLQLL